MIELQSPLRYPGSKQLLASYFEDTIEANFLRGANFYEPYAGGASVSLHLLARGSITRATLIEKDPLIYAFWKMVKQDPDSLCEELIRTPVTLESWKNFQKYLDKDALKKYGLLQCGLAGLFLNRTNFSGIIAAGPIGGMTQSSRYSVGCRLNKENLIARIRSISDHTHKLSVVHSDAITYLRRSRQRLLKEHCLVYIDPPYIQQGRKLYRYHYQMRQHRQLAKFIQEQSYPWIVSYDHHEAVKEMFAKQKIIQIFINHVVKQSRRAEELLISNIKLPVPTYERTSTGDVVSEVSPLHKHRRASI